MNEEELIKNICLYLDVLVSENESVVPYKSASKEELFLRMLEKNITVVLTEASKHEHIRQILSSYVCHPSSLLIRGDRYWNFTILCLTLIKGLNEALLSQQQQQVPDEHLTNENKIQHVPKGTLGLKQQKTIKRSLQFIIALGLLPNLIPSVRNVLRKRTEACTIVENFDVHSTVQLKYYRLLTCLLVLLECLNEKSLQAMLLTHHAVDLLAALLQICHAPIKKVNGVKNNMQPGQFRVDSETFGSSPTVNIASHQKYHDFNWIMSKLRGCYESTEEAFIREMWEDRSYFIGCLEKLLKQIPPPSLMWQLLFLQDANLGCVKDTVHGKIKAPPWLRKISNQMLTDKLLEMDGIKTFIQVAFDKMSDVDIESGSISKEKIEAVARVISHNPATHIPLEMYMQKVISQAVELIHLRSNSKRQMLTLVGSSILLQFAERNFEMVENFMLQSVFRPFAYCLQSHGKELIMDGDTVITEEDMTMCIEDAYEIFVANRAVLSDEGVKLLLPFYHLLFFMFKKFLNSISFLKSKVQHLLIAVLNNQSRENSVKLLHLAAFEDIEIQNVQVVSNIKCVYGDNGGIEITKSVTENDEDLAEDIELKCQAISLLLQKISDRRIKSSFFLSLLKKSTNEERKDIQDGMEKDDIKHFINHLILMKLVEDLGENIGDELISDIDESIELIKDALQCGVNGNAKNGGLLFTEETVISFLIILSTLISYKDQLTSSQWRALQKCISPLENLVKCTKSSVLKNMAEDICIAIQTHGAVSSSISKQQKSQTSEQSSRSAKEVEEEIKNIQHGILNDKKDDSEKLIELSSLILCDKESSSKENQAQHSSDEGKNSSSVDSNNRKCDSNLSAYQSALEGLNDSSIPARGHSLICLTKLVEARDAETLSHKDKVLEAFQKNLADEDSYIYLSAIHGLSALGNVDAKMVLPLLLSEFKSSHNDNWSYTLKVGEALLKICRNLGDLTPNFRDQFLNTYLTGVRHQDSHIRASSLSNLGEVCKALKFSIGPMLQEILLCVISVLKSDPAVEVRRASILVIALLLQGAGKDTFTVLENEIKDLYTLLKYVYYTEKDDVLKLQAQLALEELNAIVKESLQRKRPLIKEIRILDPF